MSAEWVDDAPNEHPVDEDVARITDNVELLHAHLQDWLETSYSVETRLDLLRLLRDARTSLATAEAAVEAHCAQTMQADKVVVNGWEFERRASWKRTWDHRGLAFRLATDADTGELLPTEDAVSRILTAGGIQYWRTTILKAAGIDPDEFCEKDKLRRTVNFRPVGE